MMEPYQTRAFIRYLHMLGLKPEAWRASGAAILIRTWDREELSNVLHMHEERLGLVN